jgi:hypothetical protein
MKIISLNFQFIVKIKLAKYSVFNEEEELLCYGLLLDLLFVSCLELVGLLNGEEKKSITILTFQRHLPQGQEKVKITRWAAKKIIPAT